MSNIAQVKPTAELKKIQANVQLSNTVSKQALKDATALWRDYVTTANTRRSFAQITAVADKLELIIRQVTNGCTRINPTAWSPLLRLENNLRNAVLQRVHLELNTKAANDSQIEREVA